MARFVALLIAACAVVVAQANHLPNPNTCPRRCHRYDLYQNWDANYLVGSQWIVVASTGAGSALGWYSDYNNCDMCFTYGLDCCGGCNYAYFTRISSYTNYPAFTLTQSSFNYCNGKYDTSEAFFGQAYQDVPNVYRYITRQGYDRSIVSYTDIMDPNFITYGSYSNDFAMSLGILDYNQASQILVMAFCNNFQQLTYNNYPTVLVLAQKPRLSRDEKLWVRNVLLRNGICPSGVLFRENYNCPRPDPYTPLYFIN